MLGVAEATDCHSAAIEETDSSYEMHGELYVLQNVRTDAPLVTMHVLYGYSCTTDATLVASYTVFVHPIHYDRQQ